MTTDQHQEILRTEGLSKFFPGVKALDNVDFSLRRGEIMALLGENGAGKSTLIKALTGVYHADRGTIWLEGQAISPKNTAHAQQLGIGTVYQEVNLLPNMSVADNLFIGREPKRFGLLRRKEMEKRATELMASYGFSLDVREPLNRFSVAMQQIVAICRAIDLSAKVLILDEPTASLDTQEVELLFDLMRQLRDRGVSLIFVTHFLDQVYQVSDRITVLRNGSFVGCRETCELPQIELVKMMLGRELDTHALQRAGRTLLSDKPVAAFKNYGKKGTIAPFDLEVRPGEIVGLAGLLGSGRTETAEVIFGIKPADSGTALIKGKPQTLRSHIRRRYWASASARKTGKPMASSPPPRCGKISSSLSRPSAAGYVPFPAKNSKRLPNALSASLAFAHLQLNNRLNFSLAAISKKCCFHVGY